MPEHAAMIGALERILYLKKLPVFARLTNTALAALADAMRERSFPKGSVIQEEGTAVVKIQLVVDGLIAVTRGGRKLSDAGPGTPLGSLPVLARDAQGFLGVAQLDSFTLELDSEALLEVCEDHFVIVQQTLQYLSRWVIEIEQQIGPQPTLAKDAPHARRKAGELDLVERIFLLRRLPAFARASINTLAELSRGLTEVQFEAGVPLWLEGDASPFGLVIVDGRIACASKQYGHRFTMGRGHAVGVMEAMAELPRWFDALTETKVVALHGSVEGLIDLFEDNFEMGMDYAAMLARGVLSFMDRVESDLPTPLP